MQRVPLYEVQVTARAGGSWFGQFLNKPTVADLLEAVDLDLHQLAKNVKGGDEEDHEMCCHQQERLHIAMEILSQVGDDDVQKPEHRVTVAGIQIGVIRTKTREVFK